MRSIELATGEYYHVYNRGVDKRKLFLHEKEYTRFYTSMFLFNNIHYSNPGNNPPPSTLNTSTINSLLETIKKREPLVSIVSFCLMPNHFHILLKQLVDAGVQRFMHRLGMGYAHYFNMRHRRSGRLYEGSFKAVHVHRDAQFQHLPCYIHLNALDLTDMDWRAGKIDSWSRALSYLDGYRWSSHHRYRGISQIPPIIDESEITSLFSSDAAYLQGLKEWSERYSHSEAIPIPYSL